MRLYFLTAHLMELASLNLWLWQYMQSFRRSERAVAGIPSLLSFLFILFSALRCVIALCKWNWILVNSYVISFTFFFADFTSLLSLKSDICIVIDIMQICRFFIDLLHIYFDNRFAEWYFTRMNSLYITYLYVKYTW